MKLARLTFLMYCLLHLAPVHAHHSFATHYDSSNIVEISGELIEVRMRNPHSFLRLVVVAADGSIETWDVEAHAVPLLRRLGITADTLKKGDHITVRGPRSRRPEKLLLFSAQITAASGEQFEMLQSVRRPPAETTADTRTNQAGVQRLAGKWLTHIKGQKVAESSLPLTAAALEARRRFDPQHTASSQCIPSNLPSLLMIPFIYQFKVRGDRIDIYHEYAQIDRSVTLNEAEPQQTDPGYGSRTARFENDTLVIESTGFPELSAGLASGWEPNGNGKDVPSSTLKKLIERYRVNADGSQMTLHYTVTDPVYLSAPFEDRIVYHRMPEDTEIYAFDCDVDIARRSNLNAVPIDRDGLD